VALASGATSTDIAMQQHNTIAVSNLCSYPAVIRLTVDAYSGCKDGSFGNFGESGLLSRCFSFLVASTLIIVNTPRGAV